MEGQEMGGKGFSPDWNEEEIFNAKGFERGVFFRARRNLNKEEFKRSVIFKGIDI